MTLAPTTRRIGRRAALGAMAAVPLAARARAATAPLALPRIDGELWPVAHNPDLGALGDPRQQPVDFGIWPAADGTWQIWSCIRGTRCGGKTRLLYRWQGARLTDRDWTPMGIALQADPGFGETPGGLQAPYVLREGGQYHMFYGDWENICHAVSADGKTFSRQLRDGRSGLFQVAPGANTRDPMVLKVKDRWHCYVTAHPDQKGADYCWTSPDLTRWTGPRRVAAGGAAGAGPYSAECPFVYHHRASGKYLLFRTQRYGRDAQSTVYASADPTDFGVDDDRGRLGTLPVAAPEVFDHEGVTYLAALTAGLDGIQIARLSWG